MDFHEDPVIDAMTQALLMEFGLSPRLYFPDEMVPMDWVPKAAALVRALREDGIQLVDTTGTDQPPTRTSKV